MVDEHRIKIKCGAANQQRKLFSLGYLRKRRKKTQSICQQGNF